MVKNYLRLTLVYMTRGNHRNPHPLLYLGFGHEKPRQN